MICTAGGVFAVEFWFFGLKEARACLFAGLFFIAMFLIPKTGWLGISRYDLLLIFAVSVQVAMLYFKLENVGRSEIDYAFSLGGLCFGVVQNIGRHPVLELSGRGIHQNRRRAAVCRLYVCGGRQLHHSGLAAL